VNDSFLASHLPLTLPAAWSYPPEGRHLQAGTRFWPLADAPVDEIDATLLTFKTRSDLPVWSEQFLEPAVSGRP
jgi:hypothetical protein